LYDQNAAAIIGYITNAPKGKVCAADARACSTKKKKETSCMQVDKAISAYVIRACTTKSSVTVKA